MANRKLTMLKDLSPSAASLPESLSSIIFPVKNTGPAAARTDPRKETQRSRNADREKDLQVVIHDGTRSLQLTPGGSGFED
jgi:hypothetical protein